MVRTERPSMHERRHPNERQPVLPFNAACLAMNRRDQERETHHPMQLDPMQLDPMQLGLLPPVQPDLFIDDMFIDTPLPEVDTINATTGATRRT